jgi:hypothetical protein
MAPAWVAILPGVAGARDVVFVDAGRPRAQRLPQLPDQPATELLDRLGAKDGVAHQRVDALAAQPFKVGHLDLAASNLDIGFDLLAYFVN